MYPNDELQYLISSIPTQLPSHFNCYNSNTTPAYPQLNRISNPLYQLQVTPQIQEFNNQPCFSNNSTSDEADEQQISIINEGKQRRMISNRESARRSRMRKQKHLDELWSQVVWLRNENHQLIDKLNTVSESHDKVVQENVQLKEAASELQQVIIDMRISNPFSSLRELHDDPCNDFPEEN